MSEFEMTDHTLLPCPFCGGKAGVIQLTGDGPRTVECDECHCRSCWGTEEEEVIAAWNRRTPPAAVPEPWGWLCNGKGDGWEERDKVVRDPKLIARYRERPDLWRIEPLYIGSPPAAVPDGWVLVPKEPTPEMVMAYGEPFSEADAQRNEAVYRAMLSAAPTPPVEDGAEFKVGDRVRKVTGDYQIEGVVIGTCQTSAGKVRYVVEHTADKGGFLHIYSAQNLRRVSDA